MDVQGKYFSEQLRVVEDALFDESDVEKSYFSLKKNFFAPYFLNNSSIASLMIILH